MTSLNDPFNQSKGLLGAIDALSDRRSFVTLFCTLVIVALTLAVFSVGAASLMSNGHFDTAKLIGSLGALAVWAELMVGVSATGFLLNARVRGRAQSSIGQALVLALATVHRILGVLLALALVAVAAVLVVFISLFLCKIPALGPLLFAAVYPVGALILGLLFCAGIFVAGLHGPAIWEGHSVLRTVSVLGTVFRTRLFSVVVQTLALAVLVGLVGVLVLGCLSAGLTMASAMSMSVLGQNLMEIASIEGLSHLFTGGASASYLGAGMFGASILAGMAITAPALVAIAGNCIVFANVSGNLSTEAMDQKLQGAMEAARAKAEQARHQLSEARSQLNSASSTTAVTEPPAHTCPQCHTPVLPGDVFCGGCGHRIG